MMAGRNFGRKCSEMAGTTDIEAKKIWQKTHLVHFLGKGI